MAIVLVVEDSPDTRRALVRLLKRDGHVPIEAGDGVEALEALERSDPDVMLLDVAMPRLDGLEVLARLPRGGDGATRPRTILLTAYSDEERTKRARRLGAADYFVKGSFDARALLDRVAQLAG